MTTSCTLGEMMIATLARTIEDGTLVFHGFGSPLIQLAMHVAKRLFDLAAAGRMGRMFLSGLQIDRWGNCNVTALGYPNITLKLPGGGGGCNLSCDAAHVTLWTTAHRSPEDAKGQRRFRLVEDCDFITNLGHRTRDGRPAKELGHRGNGPQWLVTELGLFDFDAVRPAWSWWRAPAPSRCLTDIAFSRELQAQQGLTRSIGWVDLAHTMTLAERGIIPRDSARALIAALLALDKAPSSFSPTGGYGDLYTNREACPPCQ
jgi:acyl CoA:acetate/3-ketoacid CoA transferase beta subunit